MLESAHGSLYSPHPGLAMEEARHRNLLKRTGRTLHEWVAHARECGPAESNELRQWLKAEHGIPTNYAWWIAESAAENAERSLCDPEALVDAMFSGAGEALRPIYERLLQLCLSLGRDVRACPGKTIVPLYRNHVFAQLKPTMRARIDLGLALRDTPVTGPLIGTGGYMKKDRITHRIPITGPEEISEEVMIWLKIAYAMDI